MTGPPPYVHFPGTAREALTFYGEVFGCAVQLHTFAEFNRADGAGFALLEEVVTALDPTNPQIAARLLTAMRSWRSLEEVRRGHAEAMLRRIAERPSLSPDVRDIVTRSLG